MSPPPRRRVRRATAALVALVVLALASAAVTAGLRAVTARVAGGGPVAVHPGPDNDGTVGDQGEEQQPITATVTVGPHLTVPILYYHYIRSVAPTPHNLLGFNLSIPPQLFAEQMALLHVEGAHVITLATLIAAMSGDATLPPRPVVLTFDDGYSDFATAAAPVLIRYGFVATDFVVSGFIGHFHYMSAAQVRAMDAAGMVIGSHTVHHVDLARVPLPVAVAEIDGGKAALEALLGHPVRDFAYPYGGFTPQVVQLVQAAGFRDAVSTIYGDEQPTTSRYTLHRTEVGGAPTLDAFASDANLPAPDAAQLALIDSLAGTSAAPDLA